MKLEDIPYRRPDGTYNWCSHQRSLLKTYNNKVRELDRKVSDLKKREQRLIREINVYKDPVSELDGMAQQEKKELQQELDEVQFELSRVEEEKAQMTEELSLHGVTINKNPSPNEAGNDDEHKTRTDWWMRHVVSFLVVWLLCEALLTAVQWANLRDILSIEQVLFRSFEIGVLILFFKIVAYRRDHDSRPIYTIYMTFNILMVLVMIFVPPLLYHSFPFGELSASEIELSFTEEPISGNQLVESNTPESEVDNIPAWADFFWNHQWIPSVLGLLFAFVVLFGLRSSSRKEDQKDSHFIDGQAQMSDDILEEIESNHQFLDQKEKNLKEVQVEILDKLAALDQNPAELSSILETMESLDAELMDIDSKTAEFKSEFDLLINDLEQELDEFKIEFMRLLKNDKVRHSTINPEWPTREDILNYFNVKNIGGTA